MFDISTLLDQYLRSIEPENPNLPQYFKAYQEVVARFGYKPVMEPGQIQILDWDLEYRSGATLGNFIDQILVRRLNDFIPDHDQPIILDCGANIGLSSLVYKRQFPKAKVIAFEPDPEFAPLLRRNLDRNGAGDVEVVEAAVWVKNGSAQWKMEGVDGSRLDDGNSDTAKRVTVQTIDLAEYLNQPIDLIKMDIEGAEYEVIEHLEKKLNNVRAISLECHLNQSTIVSFSRTLKILSAAGFRLSINSFGVWRDLIRQPVLITTEHFENYLVVSAWREPAPITNILSTWIPTSGIVPIRDYANNIQSLTEYGKKLQEYLGAIVTGRNRPLMLEGQFQHDSGYSWVAPVPLQSVADSLEQPAHSTLLLFEDDKLLVPPHSMHNDIRAFGMGRYSHWKDSLFFSTSDGSNPNTNGRKYRIVHPD